MTALNNSVSTFSPLINAEDIKLSGMVAQLRKNPSDANQKRLISVEQTTLTVYSEESMVPFMDNYNPPPVVADSLTAIASANASSTKVAKDVKSVEKSIAKAMGRKEISSKEPPSLVAWVVFAIFQVEIRRWLSSDKLNTRSGLASLRRQLKLVIDGLSPRRRS